MTLYFKEGKVVLPQNSPDGPHPIGKVLDAIRDTGGTAYFVGGSVRDLFVSAYYRHIPAESKDMDIEVYGLDADVLANVLKQHGDIAECGQSFAVMKLRMGNDVIDFSLPRKDSKVAPGHKGFIVEYDKNLSTREASKRRNFTMNSAMVNAHTGEILDHHNATRDIYRGVIRPICDRHYIEDPLRNLIGLQQSVRFGFGISSAMADKCAFSLAAHELSTLSESRIWGEWEKLFSKGVFFNQFFNSLEALHLTDMYPELAAMIRFPQDPGWHPEGSVDVHSELAARWMADYCDSQHIKGEDRIVMVAAALLHDIGKPLTTSKDADGRIRSPKHDKVATESEASPAVSVMRKMGMPAHLVSRILPLIREHMVLIGADITPALVRRLALRLMPAKISELDVVIQADHASRPPLPDDHPFPDLMDMAEKVRVTLAAPAPILLGRHLIAMGVKPGPQMGEMLKKAYDAQLDGDIVDIAGGLRLLGLGA